MALDAINAENGKYEEVCKKCYKEIVFHIIILHDFKATKR